MYLQKEGTGNSCHGNNVNYTKCLEVSFAQGSEANTDTVQDHALLIQSLTIALILIASGWMLMSMYTAWTSKSINFNQLIIRAVRAIIITSVLVYLSVPAV
jgi:integrating conjugative element protein (TIGR03758 family)